MPKVTKYIEYTKIKEPISIQPLAAPDRQSSELLKRQLTDFVTGQIQRPQGQQGQQGQQAPPELCDMDGTSTQMYFPRDKFVDSNDLFYDICVHSDFILRRDLPTNETDLSKIENTYRINADPIKYTKTLLNEYGITTNRNFKCTEFVKMFLNSKTPMTYADLQIKNKRYNNTVEAVSSNAADLMKQVTKLGQFEFQVEHFRIHIHITQDRLIDDINLHVKYLNNTYELVYTAFIVDGNSKKDDEGRKLIISTINVSRKLRETVKIFTSNKSKEWSASKLLDDTIYSHTPVNFKEAHLVYKLAPKS
jgi:hypothetical protein